MGSLGGRINTVKDRVRVKNIVRHAVYVKSGLIPLILVEIHKIYPVIRGTILLEQPRAGSQQQYREQADQIKENSDSHKAFHLRYIIIALTR